MAVPRQVRVSPFAPFERGHVAWQMTTGELFDWVSIRADGSAQGDLYAWPDFQEGRPARGCLSDLTKLADAPDDKIVSFSHEWGVMGFCA